MATTTATKLSSAAWATSLLLALQKAGQKAPVTPNNIANIQRLIGVESSGNTAGFLRDNNPWNLNTYVSPHNSLPGGKIVNEWGVNVQVFNTIQDGLNAYVGQLQSNPALLAALNNNASPSLFGGALSTSGWSGGTYANSSVFSTLKPFTGSSSYAGPAPATGNPTGWFGQWVEPVLNLGAQASIPGGAYIIPAEGGLAGQVKGTVAAAKDTIGAVTSVSGFITKITNPTNLKNVGIFVGGIALAAVGLGILFYASKEGKEAGGVAESAVMPERAAWSKAHGKPWSSSEAATGGHKATPGPTATIYKTDPRK